MTSHPVADTANSSPQTAPKPVKPAADITVWGISLILAGQGLGAIPTFAGGGVSEGWTGVDPMLMIGVMFIGGLISLAGIVMVLKGIHRIIFRNDPPPEPAYDPEKQNPDGTYKHAFAPRRQE